MLNFIKFSILLIFLLFYSFSIQAATVETIQVYSLSMKKHISANIIKPKNYSSSQKRYEVVYLLHGFGGSYKDWILGLPKNYLTDLSDKYNFIFVCPDAKNSFYLDSPVKKDSQYETFMIKELIPFIDQKYKTINSKNGRFITGISMGGQGALYLAIRNPEKYLAAGSTSGAIDLTIVTEYDWTLDEMIAILGDNKKYPERYTENSVLNMVDQLKKSKIPIIVDCGAQDEFFIEANRKFHTKLMTAIVNYEYLENKGKHDFKYWSTTIESHLIFFQKQLQSVQK